jgi:hypothetical protein
MVKICCFRKKGHGQGHRHEHRQGDGHEPVNLKAR